MRSPAVREGALERIYGVCPIRLGGNDPGLISRPVFVAHCRSAVSGVQVIRRGIDLNLRSLDRFSMLVHGDYNTFKTYLVGSFLTHLIRQGKNVAYWYVQGEENLSTLAAFREIEPS